MNSFLRQVTPFPARCINSEPIFGNSPTHVTVGKAYVVVAETTECYQIRNDNGDTTLMLKERFVKETFEDGHNSD